MEPWLVAADELTTAQFVLVNQITLVKKNSQQLSERA